MISMIWNEFVHVFKFSKPKLPLNQICIIYEVFTKMHWTIIYFYRYFIDNQHFKQKKWVLGNENMKNFYQSHPLFSLIFIQAGKSSKKKSVESLIDNRLKFQYFKSLWWMSVKSIYTNKYFYVHKKHNIID